MAIELSEGFQVNAPLGRVWQFMLDPESVAACMPGAALTESIDERNFVGSVKVKIGAITAKYAGNIAYTTTDESSGTVVMLVEAKEKGGGSVSGTITTRLAAVTAELTCISRIKRTIAEVYFYRTAAAGTLPHRCQPISPPTHPRSTGVQPLSAQFSYSTQ